MSAALARGRHDTGRLIERRLDRRYLTCPHCALASANPADRPIVPAAISPSMRSRGLMISKQVMRVLAMGASAAAVLGGGTFALASGSPPAAGRGTTLRGWVR